MKIAVIGSNGQLGAELVRVFSSGNDEVQALTHADIEISNIDSAAKCLRALRPALVINTAAMHNVDRCEAEPEKAYQVNALGARNLATVVSDGGLDCVLMHVSTDYVFNGCKSMPYEESDAAEPLNVYGRSKLDGEKFVCAIAKRYFVVRTSALYGHSQCRAKGGYNFVELMLKLARERGKVRVVDDETITPTFAAELAEQLLVLSRTDAYGVYHTTAEGACSWFEFARTIFQLTGTSVDLAVAHADEFPSKTPRPKYSVLENKALKCLGVNQFQPWQWGLSDYLGVTAGRNLTGAVAAMR